MSDNNIHKQSKDPPIFLNRSLSENEISRN